MQNFTLSVKNYRCFGDESPVKIGLGPGFTAFVGPNNSGKSSLARIFYELRKCFHPEESLPRVTNGQPPCSGNSPVLGVSDQNEILNDFTDRPAQIAIELSGSEKHADIEALDRFSVHVDPTRSQLSAEVYSGKLNVLRIDDSASREHTKNEQGVRILRIGERSFEAEQLTQLFDALSRSLYVGPFRNVITEGNASYYDLEIGTGFVQQWGEWRSGNYKWKNNRAFQVIDDIRSIFQFESLDINASDDKKSLQVVINKKSYRLHEVGAGLSQFICVFANAALKEPPLIFIDEPELHLHPSLQVDFLMRLASYATHGVVFATHSLGLARSAADRIYSFHRSDEGVSVQQFNGMSNYAEFIGEMGFAGQQMIGCDQILLVEGTSEVKAIQQLLRRLGKDQRVVLVPAGGASLINGDREQELAELKRITGRVSALIDSERATQGDNLSAARRAFLEACNKLDINAQALDRRALENYFPDHAVRREYGEKYRALGHFERIEDLERGWPKSQNWRIVRHMSRDELLATDLGKFLDSL